MASDCCYVWLDVFLVFLAVFIPPLPVIAKAGLCSADLLINIALCCLGYFPGLIHSWYIISKYPEVVEIDIERQDGYVHCHTHPVYVNVTTEPRYSPLQPNYQPNYGAVSGAVSPPTEIVAQRPSGPPPEYSEQAISPKTVTRY